jgi:hypothetical protein
MDGKSAGLADAYQLAAREIACVQRLPWGDLEPREDAPWLFGSGEIAALADARGALTIVDGYDGNPAVKKVVVALEWIHRRQGRRAVRLVTFVTQA